MDEPRPELRIGDRERRAVDAHLQQAHGDGVLTLVEYDERAAQCWAARTRSELDALVRDLPEYRPGPDAEAPTVAVPAPRENRGTAKGAPKSAGERFAGGVVGLALLGGALFLGSQVVTADDAMAIMGSQQVTVGPGQDRVEVGMIFGNVRVVVPEGVQARTTGAVVFGSTECDRACREPGREVVVDVTGAFGSVDVLRPGELTAEEAEDAAEEAEDAAEDAAENNG